MDRRLLLLAVLGGAATEINVVPDPIVPTLGAELLVNPGMEGTYDDESGGSGTANVAPAWDLDATFVKGTDVADAEGTIVHGGSASQKVVINSALQAGIQSTATLPANAWYQLGGWIYAAAGVSVEVIVDAIRPNWLGVGAGDWEEKYGTGQNTVSARSFRVRAKAGAPTFYADDLSAKQITFSSMLKLLGNRSSKNGTYICKPTVAPATIAGMIICYADDNNFVMAHIDRNNTNRARLLSRIGGTYVAVASANVTYSAGAELKVVNNAGTYTLYYNNVQVGSPGAIVETTLGTKVYGFNTYPGNEVGLVTTSPF